MKNEKGDAGAVALIVFVIIIMILAGLLVYTNIKDQLVKEEFKDFMKFQMELTTFVIEEECEMNYTETINKFLKYKTNELLNETNFKVREE